MRYSGLLLAIVLIIFSVCGVARAGDLNYYQPSAAGKAKLIACDVAVYGGMPAGVTAAIQAARIGRSVLMISNNSFVDGMTSGGLTRTDLGKKRPSEDWRSSSAPASAGVATLGLRKRSRSLMPQSGQLTLRMRHIQMT